jgi:hypothetical protein
LNGNLPRSTIWPSPGASGDRAVNIVARHDIAHPIAIVASNSPYTFQAMKRSIRRWGGTKLRRFSRNLQTALRVLPVTGLTRPRQTGKTLNQADLSRDAALSHPTAHRYLNLIETAWLIARIGPLSTYPYTTLAKARTLVWADCSLADKFAKWRKIPHRFVLLPIDEIRSFVNNVKPGQSR